MPTQKYISQNILFSETPAYSAVTTLPATPAAPATARVNVWRNHAFEPLIPLIDAYRQHTGWQADFCLTGYDDSLSFQDWTLADAELVWLDGTRLSLSAQDPAAYAAWLGGRLAALRAKTTSPVILLTWFASAAQKEHVQAEIAQIPGVEMGDLQEIAEATAIPLLDTRRAAFSGSPVNHKLHPLLARAIACQWLHAVLRPALKAVAVDLDNTLYAGILGEDGRDGVTLTEGHKRLQEHLLALGKHGLFIALVSRNIEDDVKALFAARRDFPLDWDDFSATSVSWGDKGAALATIAQTLRIAPDSILYIDDNIGELASIAHRHPSTPCIHAQDNADITLSVLRHYPGMFRWHTGTDDLQRVADLKNNAVRAERARTAPSQEDYYASLQTTLTFRNNPRDQLPRLTDLCGKTNQFNLALRRFNAAELAQMMDDPAACIVSVQLGDTLSDSGVIAVIIARRTGDSLDIPELCISCRAMGRDLEDSIIFGALHAMAIFTGCHSVAFHATQGPRNMPALDWLARHTQQDTHQPGIYNLDARSISTAPPCAGVTLITRD